MLKDKLSWAKRLTLIGAILPLLTYFSFCFFTDTPTGDNCIYSSLPVNDHAERNAALREECAPREKEYEAYLFWNILKNEATDPPPGGQGSKFEDWIDELKVNK